MLASTTRDKEDLPTPVNVEKEFPKDQQSCSSTHHILAAEACTSAGYGATGLGDNDDSEEYQLSLEEGEKWIWIGRYTRDQLS